MFPIELLPEDLRDQSKKKRHIVLRADLALAAVRLLAEQHWAINQCHLSGNAAAGESRFGELRHLYGVNRSLGSPYIEWRRGEPWGDYVRRSAALAEHTIHTLRAMNEHASQGDPWPLYFMIDAIQENIYLDRIRSIMETYFSEGFFLEVNEATTTVPLVAARLRKSTHCFSQGQRLYIYRVHGGRNEYAQVVGRYRRTHRWIRGHCLIDHLDDFRPKIVYDPQVIRKLSEQPEAVYRHVSRSIFWRFLATPQNEDE